MDTKQWKICAAYYLLSTRYVEHGSSRLTNSRYKKKSPNHYFTKRTILSLSLLVGKNCWDIINEILPLTSPLCVITSSINYVVQLR